MALDATGARLLAAVLAVMGAERALELAIHRRNAARLRARGAVWHADDGFGAILVAQLALFGLWPLETILAPWAGVHAWTWPLLALVVVAQALRYWCIATLGERWAIRVVTVPDAPRIVGGPYRWMRHPNYAVVAAEAALLPLAFGAYAALAVVVPLQLWALRRRIAREERALGSSGGPPPA